MSPFFFNSFFILVQLYNIKSLSLMSVAIPSLRERHKNLCMELCASQY
jgi:hypothetical protein